MWRKLVINPTTTVASEQTSTTTAPTTAPTITAPTTSSLRSNSLPIISNTSANDFSPQHEVFHPPAPPILSSHNSLPAISTQRFPFPFNVFPGQFQAPLASSAIPPPSAALMATPLAFTMATQRRNSFPFDKFDNKQEMKPHEHRHDVKQESRQDITQEVKAQKPDARQEQQSQVQPNARQEMRQDLNPFLMQEAKTEFKPIVQDMNQQHEVKPIQNEVKINSISDSKQEISNQQEPLVSPRTRLFSEESLSEEFERRTRSKKSSM